MRADLFSLPIALALVLPFPVLVFAQGTDAGSEAGSTDESAEASQAPEPLNDIKLLAQAAALPSLKGEDKFILRESWWSGNIAPGKAKLIQVQLFRRNSYRFWLAAPNREAELNLNVYDSEGKLVPTESESFGGTNIVSITVQPELTGVYYVRLSLKTSLEQSQDWAVIYAYR